jgi:hypothetical protein
MKSQHEQVIRDYKNDPEDFFTKDEIRHININIIGNKTSMMGQKSEL